MATTKTVNGTLIGKIVIDKNEIIQGESFLVEIYSPKNKSYNNKEKFFISINGISGSKQYLQYRTPGKYKLNVYAEKGAEKEEASMEIDINHFISTEEIAASLTHKNYSEEEFPNKILKEKLRLQAKLPILNVSKNFHQPYNVAFSVGEDMRSENGLDTPVRPLKETHVFHEKLKSIFAQVQPQSINYDTVSIPRYTRFANMKSSKNKKLTLNNKSTKVSFDEYDIIKTVANKEIGVIGIYDQIPLDTKKRKGVLENMKLDTSKTIYEWDFGDGIKESTHSLNVTHDYSKKIDYKKKTEQFHVGVTIKEPGQANKVIKRTLSVYSDYFMTKEAGIIVPKTEYPVFATRKENGYQAVIKVKNIEDYPLILDKRRLMVSSEKDLESICSGELITPLGETPLSSIITVPANGEVDINVFVNFNQVSRKSPGFTVFYLGTATYKPSEAKDIVIDTITDIYKRELKTKRTKKKSSKTITSKGLDSRRIKRNAEGISDLIMEDLRVSNTRNPYFSDFLDMVLKEKDIVFQVRLEANFEIIPRYVPPKNTPLLSPAIDYILKPKDRLKINYESTVYTDSKLVSNVFRKFNPLPLPAGGGGGIWNGALYFMYGNGVMPEEGSEYDPDEYDQLPQDIKDELEDEGWVLQATNETRMVELPGRYINARKGDILLSPGGSSGLISNLLKQVTPPQIYSHTGIMTKNYYEVAHSTASTDRLYDYPEGGSAGDNPTDGYQENALKYLRPGVVVQQIEDAIHGENMTDPENSKNYKISAFKPTGTAIDNNGSWEIIPPLVIKPDPQLETPEMRARLHQIGTTARLQNGKSHYRFFVYSDGTLPLNPNKIAPSGTGWAEGTYPTVCSSFIWSVLKREQVRLEGSGDITIESDIEAADTSKGAEVNATTQDGTYLYRGDERRQGADWLKQALYNQVIDAEEQAAGNFGGAFDFFTDMADDVSNQITNAFASDYVGGGSKDSEDWKNISDANATSPDNILFWDSPQVSGLYGYSTPSVYRERSIEEVVVYRWKKVLVKGNISGTVTFAGQNISGARVEIPGWSFTSTDSQGNYSFSDVPLGNYIVKASKDNYVNSSFPDGAYLEGEQSINLDQANETLDIALTGPDESRRKITIGVTMETKDDEPWPWSDEHNTYENAKVIDLNPNNLTETVSFTQRMGGEIRIETYFHTSLRSDNSVIIDITAKMYEGTSTSTDDLDDTETRNNFVVEKNMSRSSSIHLYNDETFGGDESDISFTIENKLDTF